MNIKNTIFANGKNRFFIFHFKEYNKMRKCLPIVLFFVLSVAAKAQTNDLYLEEPVFHSGETAKFNIYFNWGFLWVHAGDIDFSVQTKKLNGETVYSLKVVGYTIKAFEKMYKIRDTFEVFVDTVNYYPVYYREVKHEDSYYANTQYFYQRQKDSTTVKAHFVRKKREWKDTFSISNNTFDLISTCYRVRNLDDKKLILNQLVSFSMLFDREVYNVGLTYKGKENVSVRNKGKYKAMKFVPKLVTGDLFKKEEDMTIYVSDDKSHVPLLIEAKIKVGYIKAVLADVKDTKYPMTSLISK